MLLLLATAWPRSALSQPHAEVALVPASNCNRAALAAVFSLGVVIMKSSSNSLESSCEQRLCKFCAVALASDNSSKLCTPCLERYLGIEPEEPGDDELTATADGSRPEVTLADVKELLSFLGKHLSTLGFIGMEFVFFHQFFNKELQDQLKCLRRQLYGDERPPMPIGLQEAERTFGSPTGPTLDEFRAIAKPAIRKATLEYMEQWLERTGVSLKANEAREAVKLLAGGLLARAETDETLRRDLERISINWLFREGLRKGGERWADEVRSSGLPSVSANLTSLDILAKPIPDDVRSEKTAILLQVANHLHELGSTLPANDESLSMAVVCGTPPVPPMSVIDVVTQPNAPLEIHIKVYSAKLRRLQQGYQIASEIFFPKYGSPSESPPIHVVWSDTFPPYLEMRITPRNGVVPRPSQVGQAFKQARTGKRFYDSKTKVKDYHLELEAWAKATLRLACGMRTRKILEDWVRVFVKDRDELEAKLDELDGDELEAYFDELYRRPTTSQEVVLSQQVKRIWDRIQEIRSLMGR